MKYLSATILTSLLSLSSFASNPVKPAWIGNPPSGTNTYYFVVVHSDMSSSLDGAREYSLKELASNVERTDKVSVEEVYSDNSYQQYSNGRTSISSTDTYSLELHVTGSSAPIHSRRIDEYWCTVDRGGIKVLEYSALFAVERNGTRADFSSISVTDHYGFNTMWRSFIAPGWGQMYKKSYLKGSVIMAGVVGLTGGILYTESQRMDYSGFMSQTHNADIIRKYQTRINHWTTARNICILGLATTYIWNTVDALVAPGASNVIIHDNRLNLTPIAYSQGGTGMLLTYRF